MCGIAGIFNLDGEPVSSCILRKMTDAIAHRGPDGEGFYVDSFVGLGHRRLAVIDISPLGHQPMMTLDGMHIISYNGEVYNFQELRTELESLGWSFKSKTDSEVVLKAYSQWGIDCLKRFNGMFAFAIWDRSKQELFLARDRFGIKPLYYTLQNNKFFFASEIKAIRAHPAFRSEMNKEALAEYCTFQNFFTDSTLFKGVNILPGGSFLKVQLGNYSIPSPKKYWDYSFREPENPKDEREYLEELDRLFQQAVNRQLVSDVEVGSYLSGGMDSGSITAVAATQLPYINSFTVGFDLHSASGVEIAFDEREKAEYMSYLFQTEHYEMVLKAGDMERAIPSLTWHLEEPRVGQSYPNFYAAQLASKFVTVVLAGTGGDELFGGYPWRYYRAVNSTSFDNYIDQYYNYWQRLVPQKNFAQLLSPLGIQLPDTREIFRSVFSSHAETLTKPEDYINHSLYFEAKTFLHGLLVVEDKLSMAHSLESRVPFLDNDLVDFAMNLPVRMKINQLDEVMLRIDENLAGRKTRNYFEKTKDGKRLLRQVMRNYIPTEVTDAVKQGFSAPDASWFKGKSIDFVKRELLNERAPLYEFIDFPTAKNLIYQHFEGKANCRLLIWSLLYLNSFCQQFLNGPTLQKYTLKRPKTHVLAPKTPSLVSY
jgi:asparagine synthase (glutamine-hydrolysing)